MIEVVGHFGTLFSYATVGGRVAEELLRIGLLARVSNIDAEWHPRWQHLAAARGKATHCIVFAAPNQYMTVYPDIYGDRRSAIFVSPNTDRLDDEHRDTICRFGMAIAPSAYCAQTVARHLLDRHPERGGRVSTCEIGSPVSMTWRERRMDTERRMALLNQPTPTVLHFTTDQAWPGRKGTEELLRAWKIVRDDASWRGARLVVHGPPSIERVLLFLIRDLGIDETVQFVAAPRTGEGDEVLKRLYREADLAVLPSRSEGFGMMILGALHAGVPLVTTCNTGHAEFLSMACGSWLAVPTPLEGQIAYERGLVPMVEPDMLAATLRVALEPSVRRIMMDASRSTVDDDVRLDAWSDALPSWVETIKGWMEET